MTVSQVEDIRTVAVDQKPRERTRTRSAPYSYAIGECSPTCSCAIFGLEGHSKSRLTVCSNVRNADQSQSQRRRVATEEAESTKRQTQHAPIDQAEETINKLPAITAASVKEISDTVVAVENVLKDTTRSTRTRTTVLIFSSKESPLTHPIHELLKTEQDYVENLVILVEVFLWRLAALSWIPQQKKDAIVRNASEILTFQLNFLALLEKACVLSMETQSVLPIAECFVQMGNGFSVYTEYCIEHESSLKVCRELSSKLEWQTFEQEALAEVRHTSSQRKLQFQDFLIKPVQRICRYQLLLKEIGKSMPDSPDNKLTLQEALNIMHSVVNSINTEKQKRDVELMTSRFIQRLEGDWRLNKRSLQLLGNVIYSGALEMLSLHHINEKVKYYGCFLFSTYMVIVRAKKSTVYEPKHWFPLRQFSLQVLQDNNGYLSNSWLLVSGQHMFEFGASCAQEKQIWIKAIQDAISLLKPEDRSKVKQSTVQKGEECPEDMLVSSLEEAVKSPSPKLRSRSLANIKDATSVAATWMHMSNKSPQPVRPKQSYSTPNSVANTPRISQEVLFSKSRAEEFQRENNSYSETLSMTEGKQFSDIDPKPTPSMSSFTNCNYSPLESPGKGRFKSPKSAHKDSRKAVVDQKLLDVSTQEVLNAKALSAREKDLCASRSRRLSFGKGASKQPVASDNSDITNNKQKPCSISRRQSHEIVAKKLRPRSNDIPIAVAYGQHSDSYLPSNEQSTRTHTQEHQPVHNESEAATIVASAGFFEKVIDKFSAISSPHRQRPPAIKTNLSQVVRSNSLKMLISTPPTSASSSSSMEIDAYSESQDSQHNESEYLHDDKKSDPIVEEEQPKSSAHLSQHAPGASVREGSKFPSWIRTPVSRRRRDSRMKQ